MAGWRRLVFGCLLGGGAVAATPSLTPLNPAQQAQQMRAVQAFDQRNWAVALPIFMKLAALGDARSETDLGEMYYHGWGVARDQDEAFDLQIQAAAQHYAKAEDNLGKMYLNAGIDDKAFAEFTLAAQAGDPVAESDLGQAYRNGSGVDEDQNQALKWFKLSAAQGYARGEYHLGEYYNFGWAGPQDYAAAMKYYQLAAAQGDADAKEGIGQLYRFGEGVPVDDSQAVKWFLASANESCGCAANDLGIMYENGLGVPKDDVTAFSWYQRAAAMGNVEGEASLGHMYRLGIGVPVDDQKAAYWFQKAIDNGADVDAEVGLGLLYLDGEGVEQNKTEADQLFRAAIGNGDANEEAAIGATLRDDGHFPEALQYLTAASENYDPDAQVNLGYMYETGEGVAQNYSTELKWALITKSILKFAPPDLQYDKAEIANLTTIHMNVDFNHLSRAQVIAAAALASAWLQAHSIEFDSSLIPPAPVPSPTWPIYAAVVSGILLSYGLAKSIQRRVGK